MWQSCCWRRSCWTICWHPRGMVAEGLAAGLSPRVRGNHWRRLHVGIMLGSIPACAGEPLLTQFGRVFRRVYPRVCGGTRRRGHARLHNGGLSPRVRGNPGRRRTPATAAGSIPACAGEPERRRSRSQLLTVYPRVCGGTTCLTSPRRRSGGLSPRVRGNRTGSVAATFRLGLSPRVRGNLLVREQGRSAAGSIPACAGEPGTPAPTESARRVYPRVCGGTSPEPRRAGAPTGLSPRVRGNLIDSDTGIINRGSIPACAGEPSPTWSMTLAGVVYPRVCGGTAPRRGGHDPRLGLSPRVRGNRAAPRRLRGIEGSIPACAGEPTTGAATASTAEVYPRVCGGTDHGRGDGQHGRGLSPRVRGNRRPSQRHRAEGGSIPACAGEPRICVLRLRVIGVYPRVCGGTSNHSRRCRSERGLSPRVRGNLIEDLVEGSRAGSIPACAGEPVASSTERTPSGVYPRVCGGTVELDRRPRFVRGLSPRVRGNLAIEGGRSSGRGSIPACAGEPAICLKSALVVGVYPRVCGGTWDEIKSFGNNPGLSPRVRGNRGRGAAGEGESGSIPACAGEPATTCRRSCARRVYPRVCGGTPPCPCRAPSTTGLSPRVRGNRLDVGADCVADGSIPACAGEPPLFCPFARLRGVYPRVCGGTTEDAFRDGATTGLSPRVRGNRPQHVAHLPIAGSIPACAGEPAKLAPTDGSWRVYPRVCGGTVVRTVADAERVGLSPRVRGNPAVVVGVAQVDGSIPACAGEPPPRPRSAEAGGVYPRVCGGTRQQLGGGFADRGLSPRVRGNRRRAANSGRRRGSIPACAGEPIPFRTSSTRLWVYPRVCGGTGSFVMFRRLGRGLSPRVRGNPERRPGAAAGAGSIPACAGEPRSSPRHRSPKRVYPRVCGGTANKGFEFLNDTGLSPRVRGNPRGSAGRRPARRSIPACAGEPLAASICLVQPRVYPRVCGGTPLSWRCGVRGRGLSPRVRGNQPLDRFAEGLGGSIPACAGEPTLWMNGASW